jgi:N-carbamoyl-L-amino-acid hydrolase
VLRVDAERFRADWDALGRFGATPAGGVHRPAFGDAHLAAREWLLARARDAGLEAQVDSAGNHSAVLPSRVPGAPTLLLGSHLDSQPYAGRFDGALGVAAALEAVRSVQDAGLELPVTLEAIDFTEEEGTLVGSLGSRALTGQLTREMLEAPRGGRRALVEGLARAGLTEEGLLSAARDPATLAGCLELHIEQGPVLERDRVQIGVVTAISGTRTYKLALSGVAAHSGGTPMDARRDAGVGAAAFVLGVRGLAIAKRSRANVGGLELEPGNYNIVPARARLMLELRSHDPAVFDELEAEALSLAQRIADEHGLGLEVEFLGRWDPCALDPEVRGVIAAAAEELGLSAIELPSGAGHDAEALAQITPTGMIFVPSVGGVSHAPEELTEWPDCVNGANVLLNAVLRLAANTR